MVVCYACDIRLYLRPQCCLEYWQKGLLQAVPLLLLLQPPSVPIHQETWERHDKCPRSPAISSTPAANDCWLHAMVWDTSLNQLLQAEGHSEQAITAKTLPNMSHAQRQADLESCHMTAAFCAGTCEREDYAACRWQINIVLTTIHHIRHGSRARRSKHWTQCQP